VFTTGVVIASVAILLPSLSPVSDQSRNDKKENQQKPEARLKPLIK
jgi:hypothetical protein